MRLPLMVVALALVLAGCVTPTADEAPAPAATPEPAAQVNASPAPAQTGRLVVHARMPDLAPLSGAEVTAGNETLTTDADGVARFDALAPGPTEVVARKAGHRTALVAVEVIAGQEVSTEVELAAEGGDQHAHEDGMFAHRDLYTFEGHFDCSATYVIITGDCLILVENVSHAAGVDEPTKNVSTERHIIDFPLDINWTALIVEMQWTSSAPTPATGQDMQLALEPAEAPSDGHAAKYARAVGGSPLRIEMTPGAPHATATAEDMPNPNGGEVIRSRVFVTGVGHNAGDAGFLGVGAAAQQTFTLYVSIFYESMPEAGYTAVA